MLPLLLETGHHPQSTGADFRAILAGRRSPRALEVCLTLDERRGRPLPDRTSCSREAGPGLAEPICPESAIPRLLRTRQTQCTLSPIATLSPKSSMAASTAGSRVAERRQHCRADGVRRLATRPNETVTPETS